jgi:hypothetical protein
MNVVSQHTGPTLRMAFHDCGTWQRYPKPAFDKNPQCGGCNGSFKKEYEDGKTTGFCTFPQQNGECISCTHIALSIDFSLFCSHAPWWSSLAVVDSHTVSARRSLQGVQYQHAAVQQQQLTVVAPTTTNTLLMQTVLYTMSMYTHV